VGDGQEYMPQLFLTAQRNVHIDIMSVMENEDLFIKEGFPGPGHDDDLLAAVMTDNTRVFT
jgi:hypothetical protein